MNKKVRNIEQLYRESFEDFRIEPSSGLWKRISSKLAWKTFIKFNPTTFNAYYLTGILAVSIAGVLLITNPVTEKNQEIKEITINNTIANPVITTVQEVSRKSKVKTEEQRSIKDIKSVSKKQTSSSSAIVTKKAENQELISGIKHVSPRTQYLVPSTRELATPHPKPKTQNPPSTQNPAPSTDLPDPWPNIDSLFTNQTPTPPQHTIQFPNAFTPNPNGPTNGYYTPGLPNNNVFHPEYKGVVEYHLRIFNRRGELIFESKNINTGWDGYINDRLAAQDVYVWKARGRYSNGQSFVKFGNIMLIKK